MVLFHPALALGWIFFTLTLCATYHKPHHSTPHRHHRPHPKFSSGGRKLCKPRKKHTPSVEANPSKSTPKLGKHAQIWLKEHNRFRSQYGSPPLVWDPDLVLPSQQLVQKCIWQHTQNNKYGENMSAGQKNISEVVDGWVNGPGEKHNYDPRNPVPSHFSQVAWVGSKRLGCQVHTCVDVKGCGLPQSPLQFWGCTYDPPGNVMGEFQENVKASRGGAPKI
ncbi:hypothetical protein O181_019251 [Austropuccinia psidii MF-1]|uniref:SCP domain-containing protein n=1 Tax=Austropuccinia psidii MF-1 TaxID=1389203 RepID=A0A9Q3C6T3_9BASI|nr:hypothetical protein [Austropuccinia psidii MF-1]